MRGAERVVDVDVGEPRQRGRERRVVGRLAGVEAHVLEQQDVAVAPAPPRPARRPRRRSRRTRRPARRAARPGARAPAPARRPGSGAPFGRPRCEQRITRAPRSRSAAIVGSAARMRVSSLIAPSCSGTLKSTRQSTRRPATSSASRPARERAGHRTFVIRSTSRLEKPHSLSYQEMTLAWRPCAIVSLESKIDEYGVADDVLRDDLVLGVGEDALPAGPCRPCALTAALISSTLASRPSVQTRSTTEPSGTGTRIDMPSSLPLQLGDHDADRARRAGRGRDDRERRGACAAQVGVRHVVQALIARVGVRRRHEARLDAELVQQHAHDGRQAVGRARRHRDQVVLVAVVGLLVDAQHERHVGILGGRGDHDLARRRR